MFNFCKEMIQPQKLRIGNYIDYNGEIMKLDGSLLCCYIQNELEFPLNPIPLTEENFLKLIDWDFEEGFNIKRKSNEFWEETCYLMENIIDGSGDFEVWFSKSKVMNDIEVSYWIDNQRLEFRLSDTLHNFQNLFYISTGQDLPIKK